jgi:hypothetical protein
VVVDVDPVRGSLCERRKAKRIGQRGNPQRCQDAADRASPVERCHGSSGSS